MIIIAVIFWLIIFFSTLIGLVVTLLIGWLIVFGMSYQLLIIISFGLILFSDLCFKDSYKTPIIDIIIDPSYIWIRKFICLNRIS